VTADAADTVAPEAASALTAWLERTLDGRVLDWRRLVAGNSRTTWAVDVERGAERLELVVRIDAGDGPFSDTPLTLAREAAVYRAVQGHGVPIPATYGYDADLDAVALERVAGEPAWDLDVLDALLTQLAHLHAVDADALDVPGMARSARGELELWAEIAQRRIHPASPFVDFALAFLRDRFPGEPARLVFLHGDPGPGNLLTDAGTITALLDWEMSHFGDPHDDLAFLSVRAALFGLELPDFAARVRDRYGAHVDTALDDDRLRFWQAVSVLRNLIICLASISNPVRGRDRLVHHMLVPSLNRMLVDVLAAIAGVALEPPAAHDDDATGPPHDVLADVAAGLTDILPATTDPDARQRLKRMRLLVGQLAETWPRVPALAAAARAEPPLPHGDPTAALHWLSRAADRQLAAYPRARALALSPLPRL
jgi:aminoglycoside phosphotransferase (APT) family kinase protein